MANLLHNILSFWTLPIGFLFIIGALMVFGAFTIWKQRWAGVVDSPLKGDPGMSLVSGLLALLISSAFFVNNWETVDAYQSRQTQKAAKAEADHIRQTTTCDHDRDVSMAWVMAEKAARATLKAPSTAVFARYDPNHVIQKDCHFMVVSYVDAQNSYGANLRSHFSVTMDKDPATREWTMGSVVMGQP